MAMIHIPPIIIPNVVFDGGIPSIKRNTPPTHANKQNMTNKHPINKVNLRSVSNENKVDLFSGLYFNEVVSVLVVGVNEDGNDLKTI